MSMVPTPTPVFYEANGAPLQNGYIYIGTADMDPIANPIQVYWDEALTITATQPIRTLGGYPSYQGKPARLFVAAGSYSITVKNKSLITIISQATANWSFITVSDLASTASGKGAYLVSSAAIVARPEDYGAVANGTSDDSAAFTSAITARRNVKLAAGKSYAFKDIVLSNSQSIDGTETILKGYTGGANLLTLKDYGSKFSNAYANDGLSLSGPYIKVLGGRFTKIESLTLTNAKNGAISLEPTGVTHSDVGSVSDLSVEGVETTAINISSSVSTWNFDNLYLDGKLVDTGSGLESTTGSVGWRQNTPVVSGNAVGGHNINNVTMLNFDTGIYMTDAQLTKFSNMAVDSCGGYGIKIDGSSYHIDFADLFVGYTAGIYVGGTAVVNIDGLRTNGNGVIPTWGSATFYHVSGPYYDVNVNNTASLTIANWRGPKTINVASGAELIVLDGVTYEGKSVGTVAAATTTYLGAQGQSTTEADVQWRAPYDCYLLRISATVVAAPSAGQSFTYTARINGTNTALTQTITDTSFGGLDAWAGTAILVTKGQTLSIKLDTSAAAVATRHNCLMQVAPR